MIRSEIYQFQLERMIASKTSAGCAVILLLLLSSASALTLTHEDVSYPAADYVKGHTQILNACYKALPEDKATLFEWVKGPANTLVITSCSNQPAKLIKRQCTYTLGPILQPQGVDFTLRLGTCSIVQNGVGCIDPVPNYLERLNKVNKLELLSDRFNFRQTAGGNIQLVTQNKH